MDGGDPGEVGRAGSNMVELDGAAVVSIMMEGIVGEVRISAGMGSSRSRWSKVSEWAVASDVDGEAGVSIGDGSFKGDGGSSPNTSFKVEIGVLMSYLCTSGTSGPTAEVPFRLTNRPCHLF